MIYGRTNARESSGDAVVFGDFARPNESSAVLLDCEEIATPIGKVNCVTGDGRSGGNIATGCENPFWCQTLDVGQTD